MLSAWHMKVPQDMFAAVNTITMMVVLMLEMMVLVMVLMEMV